MNCGSVPCVYNTLGDRGTIGNFWKLAPFYFQRKILPTQQGSQVRRLTCEGMSPTWNKVHIIVFYAAGVSFMQLVYLLCSWCVFCAGSVSPLYVSLRPEGPSTAELVDRRFQMFPHDPVFPLSFFFWIHKLSIRYDFFSSHVIF